MTMKGKGRYIFFVAFLLGIAWVLTMFYNCSHDARQNRRNVAHLEKRNGNLDGALAIAEIQRTSQKRVNRVEKVKQTERPTSAPPRALSKLKKEDPSPTIQISCVICGSRMEQALVMIKSLVVFTKAKPHLNLFVENNLMHQVYSQIEKWPSDIKDSFEHTIHPVQYPLGLNQTEWKGSYWPCSTFRLFLPYLLPKLDASIYLDTDLILFNPVEDLWSLFHDFSSVQLTAMVREHEDASIGWYNRFAKHPYYPPLGLNSAVMLMNFTRMREFGWMKLSVKLFNDYKGKLPWTDQDIMNIIYHYHPEKVFLLPCNWNFRMVHCHYKDKANVNHLGLCPDAETKGAYIVHGNDRAFRRNNWPAIRVVHKAMKNYEFGSNLRTGLLDPLLKYVEGEAKGSPCWEKKDVITLNLKRLIEESEQSWHTREDAQIVKA